MFGYIKALSAARRAEAAYRLAVLENLICQNEDRMWRLRKMDECRFCKDIETAKQRKECEDQFTS